MPLNPKKSVESTTGTYCTEPKVFFTFLNVQHHFQDQEFLCTEDKYKTLNFKTLNFKIFTMVTCSFQVLRLKYPISHKRAKAIRLEYSEVFLEAYRKPCLAKYTDCLLLFNPR